MPISFSIPSSLSVSGTTTTAALTVGSLTGVLTASSGVVSVGGAITTSGLTMSTSKMLGRATSGTGAIEEIAVTGSGSAVLATSPALVTPSLGVASATSIAVSGNQTIDGTLSIGRAYLGGGMLVVEGTVTDTDNIDNFILNTNTRATTNGSFDIFGLSSQTTSQHIPGGVTDAGGRTAITGDAYSNQLSATFAGTLASQIGVRGRAGFAPGGASAGAIVTTAYGIFGEIRNGDVDGTISTAIAVYATNSEATGTITDRYDFYGASSNAKNYFAGKVGIKTSTPTYDLEVSGTGYFSTSVSDPGGTLASQRNALAPAQGIVASGAAVGANATLVNALGTGDFSIAFDVDVPAAAPAASSTILQIATARVVSTAYELGVYHSTDDSLRFLFRGATSGDDRTAFFPALAATYPSQRLHGVFTRTGTTVALKLNDVTVTLSSSTVGSPPAWSAAITGTLLTLGQFGDSYPWTGFVSAKLYNYVLSTAQQTQLFRTGAVSAADINTVYNDANAASLGNPIGASQSMITGSNSTFAAATGFWTLGGASPATISGGVANFPAGSSTVSRANFLKVGSVYTLLVGSKTGTLVFDGGVATTAITAGTAITFAATQTTLQFYTAAGGTMDDVTLTPLGATFAPEAAAPGAGLEWLDASGNRSHLALPTSGISWALPSSQQIVIEATTNTATNQQLAGASIIDTNKQWRIQSWTVNCSTGTPTISLGNVSAGAQYVSGAVLAAGNNDVTLLTRFPTTANLWCNSSTTATLIHRIVLVPAN